MEDASSHIVAPQAGVEPLPPGRFLGSYVAYDGVRRHQVFSLRAAANLRVGEGGELCEDGRLELSLLGRGPGPDLLMQRAGLGPAGLFLREDVAAQAPGRAWRGVLTAPALVEPSEYHLEYRPGLALAPSTTHGHGVIATLPFQPGEAVLAIRGPMSETQSPYSFRTADGGHVEPTGYGHFVNHACEPSCEIVYRADGRPMLVAVRHIGPGDEICFDYSLTEGDLAGDFDCACEAKDHRV
jgi:hypothetical protein